MLPIPGCFACLPPFHTIGLRAGSAMAWLATSAHAGVLRHRCLFMHRQTAYRTRQPAQSNAPALRGPSRRSPRRRDRFRVRQWHQKQKVPRTLCEGPMEPPIGLARRAQQQREALRAASRLSLRRRNRFGPTRATRNKKPLTHCARDLWSRLSDSNRSPAVYKAAALPDELRRLRGGYRDSHLLECSGRYLVFRIGGLFEFALDLQQVRFQVTIDVLIPLLTVHDDGGS